MPRRTVSDVVDRRVPVERRRRRTRRSTSGDGVVVTVVVEGELDLGARPHWEAAVTPLLTPPCPERIDVDLARRRVPRLERARTAGHAAPVERAERSAAPAVERCLAAWCGSSSSPASVGCSSCQRRSSNQTDFPSPFALTPQLLERGGDELQPSSTEMRRHGGRRHPRHVGRVIGDLDPQRSLGGHVPRRQSAAARRVHHGVGHQLAREELRVLREVVGRASAEQSPNACPGLAWCRRLTLEREREVGRRFEHSDDVPGHLSRQPRRRRGHPSWCTGVVADTSDVRWVRPTSTTGSADPATWCSPSRDLSDEASLGPEPERLEHRDRTGVARHHLDGHLVELRARERDRGRCRTSAWPTPVPTSIRLDDRAQLADVARPPGARHDGREPDDVRPVDCDAASRGDRHRPPRDGDLVEQHAVERANGRRAGCGRRTPAAQPVVGPDPAVLHRRTPPSSPVSTGSLER